MTATGAPAYGPRYEEALAYAARLHASQFRKADEGVAPSIPYVAHLLEVSSLVWQGGGSEDAAIAGLLHDAIEDQSHLTSYAEIERRFGPRVCEIVRHCTDGEPGGDRGGAGWLDRKVEYLLRLWNGTDDEALLVTVADKVSNAGSILEDLRQCADALDVELLWNRFKAGAQGTAWYYAEASAAASSRKPHNPLVQRLAVSSDRITAAAGGVDVAASLSERLGLSADEARAALARLDLGRTRA